MVTITADLTSGYCVEIRNGRHVWRADEPVSKGGTDTGPTPYELLLGSVAACTLITLSMYAQRKGIEVDSMSVQYTYDRHHARDTEDCVEGREGQCLDHVSSQIFIDGSFTDDERTRLADIALRCPVHRTLERGLHFDDKVVVG